MVIVGTLDTKGPEVAYLRDQIRSLGLGTTVVDSGILGEPLDIEPDIDHAAAARYGGTTIEALREAGSRGRAVAGMRAALRALTLDLFRRGELDAMVGLGGAEGAVMAAGAMMVLPIGVPKVVVSPIASGKHFFDPLVGTRDMMVVHSVVDILGLNRIARTVFDNVAGAIAGMVAHGHPLGRPEAGEGYVAVTMLGNTTTAVMAVKRRLAAAGMEAVIFHSNGVGGPAMEELAEDGHFVGVVDFTTNETYDPMVGGIHDGGPERLARVGKVGLPQVVVPGCIDFAVFNAGTVPPELAGRPVYDHNPEYVLVRNTEGEMRALARLFAERLNPATGPVAVAIPTAGLSIPNVPDGPFWDPPADAAFRLELAEHLRPDLQVTSSDRHVNDPEFGEEVAEIFIEMMREET